MNELASGSLLGQNRPSDTSNATLFEATLGTEITSIAICNVTGSPVTFRLFHDLAGTTYDESNALYFDKQVLANDTLWVGSESEGAGIQMEAADSLGVRSSVGDALTFTAYGVTSRVAQQLLQRRQTT